MKALNDWISGAQGAITFVLGGFILVLLMMMIMKNTSFSNALKTGILLETMRIYVFTAVVLSAFGEGG